MQTLEKVAMFVMTHRELCEDLIKFIETTGDVAASKLEDLTKEYLGNQSEQVLAKVITYISEFSPLFCSWFEYHTHTHALSHTHIYSYPPNFSLWACIVFADCHVAMTCPQRPTPTCSSRSWSG